MTARLKADTTYKPSPGATWLLRRALPKGVRGDTILGDLVEEWHARAATPLKLPRSSGGARPPFPEGAPRLQPRGRWAATFWYWRQALLVVAHYAWRRERSHEPAGAGAWSMRMSFDNLLHDLRYAVRSYAKAPSFTIVVLTTLALGIGASTAIFSMVNGTLLQPLPFPDPDRLVYVNETNPKGNFMSVSWPNYLDWRRRTRSFDALALSRDEPLTLTGGDRAQRVRADESPRTCSKCFESLRRSAARSRTQTTKPAPQRL
jgi:hypothetical protein